MDETDEKLRRQKEKERHQEIEAYLKQEKDKMLMDRKNPKILILGTSDSGKSTLVKQLKILHGGGFTKEEVI
jgi:polynucleotide 5'-kinase involved in rRNA processing